MKGYLKSADGIFQLAPKVTTVGREGCDLVVQTAHVDFQHAVIEYSETEDCYVLQDLNTSQGTYVNECRVQNAAVRLAPGDIIRFGYAGFPYELALEQPSQMAYPPVHQRAAWTQPLTVISDPIPPQVIIQETLPHLHQVVATTTSTWDRQPRPPNMTTIRSRPLSAGAIRSNRVQTHTTQQPRDGWIQNGRRALPPSPAQSPQIDVLSLQEKHQTPCVYNETEQRILRLQEEIKRLQGYEQECFRKDDLMHILRQEVGDLQVKVRRFETTQQTQYTSNDPELTQKLMQLENEVQHKRQEVQHLKDQLSRMRSEQRPSSGGSRQELNDRVMEINSLRTELERVKKDKNITAGLVTQIQRDMSNKDTSISRLTTEITNFKKEINERELQIQQLHTKLEEWHKSPESRQRSQDLEEREKEAAFLRVQIKQQDTKLSDQAGVISALKLELEKIAKESTAAVREQSRIQKEYDTNKCKLQDLERAERLVRVDLEQGSKRMERFRNRVVQVTFSTPGIKAPENEITDDELLETLKQIIDQRTSLQREVSDLRGSLSTTDKGRREILDSSKKLKDQLNQAVSRLKEKGHLSGRLKQELDFVQTISVHESVAWMRDCFHELVQGSLAWQSEIESALEKCQVNIKISEDAPWMHILGLREKAVQLREERDELRSRIDEISEQNQKDLETALEALSIEMEEKAKMEQEKLKLESEEKFNRSLDEIRSLEDEKRQSSTEEQRTMIVELESNIEKLKMYILDMETTITTNKEDTSAALEELEKYKNMECELRKHVECLENTKSEEVQRLTVEISQFDTKRETEMTSYKEQIRQHSVTICAMEERLNKVVKKNKDYQAEIATFKSTVTDLREKLAARPQIPPKPKVIIQKPAQDVVAMEAVIGQMRLDNNQLQVHVQQSEDVILALRRDLAGASAKLTDMTGELSESQKEEIERHRSLVKQQDHELTECRQQLAKLSELVDKQSSEIKVLNTDLSKQRSSLNKYKSSLSEKASALQALESDLETQSGANKKNLSLLEEEGRITSELTAVGSQCRGERHESVIARQREALTELRARVKSLEMSNPPLPTKDQALQQVVLLKKELSELRVSQALAETTHSSGMGSTDASILAQQVSRARGIDPHARAESEVERSAHRETMEALELSEQSYLVLLRGVASSLEMDEIGGLRSMAHIPRDERSRLSCDRETACELVSSRIKVLKERIARKDELLQGYENDLAKLRQAEKLAEQKHLQVESLSSDMRSRTEESQYLRESLQRTKDRLEQERRLNTNIKSKKTFHLENEKVQRNGWPKHHCKPDDIMGKQTAQKKAQREQLRRKNYEINTLKSELSTRDQDLAKSRRRFITMEASTGLEYTDAPCVECEREQTTEPAVLFSEQ